jgi:predicted PurR-regulated permease PerM
MLNFTEGQKKVVSAGLTVLASAVVFVFVAAVIKAIVSILSFAAPAIVPVILGFFLALFFRPYYAWWKRVFHNPTLALVVMLMTVFLPLGFLLWYAGAVLVDQLSNFVRQGPQLFAQVTQWFQCAFPKLHSLLSELGIPYDNVGALYDKYGASALKAGSGVLRCLSGVLSVLVALIFFVFFLMTKERHASEIVRQLVFLKDDTKTFVTEQIDAFVDILVSFFQRQTVICLIEGIMYGTGFWIVGLPYGFLVGFALGVMNLIPFFGSIICLPVALPLAYFAQGGSLTRLVLVLCVWLAGQFLDGYFITPKIQGDKTGLGYAGVIFSFFFWSTVLGPLMGMLLAIPLSAFCVVLWRALKAKYIKPVV